MTGKSSATPAGPDAVREAHGASIPALGFGTSGLHGDEARRMTEIALESGYRHIDTAEDYGNEGEIGAAWQTSGIEREDLFLTSKVWPNHFVEGAFRASVEGSLERLGTDYLDLLLLHWPLFEDTNLEAVVERLNAARNDGLAKYIGVSNFNVRLVERAWSATSFPLVANEVEYHPFLDQGKTLRQAADQGMVLIAYCPVARGRTARDPVLHAIGEAHGKTGAQVALRWLLQQGAVPIPRTSSLEHCLENRDIFDFQLGPDEMTRIHELARPDGRLIDPEHYAPEWD